MQALLEAGAQVGDRVTAHVRENDKEVRFSHE
jgi:hypothetical protein